MNVCSPPHTGSSFALSGHTPTVWTQFGFNFTATSPIQTLSFRFEVGLNDYYYLDDVSVVNVNAPGTQLLTNPSFENSPTTIVNWTVACSVMCSFKADLETGINCYLLLSCLRAMCNGHNETVSQKFGTTIGDLYSVSFWLRLDAFGPSAPLNRFYIDVY